MFKNIFQKFSLSPGSKLWEFIVPTTHDNSRSHILLRAKRMGIMLLVMIGDVFIIKYCKNMFVKWLSIFTFIFTDIWAIH